MHIFYSCYQAQGAAAATAAAAAAMNINVFLRVRPLPQDYTGGRTLTVMDEGSVALCAPLPEAGQRDYKGEALAVNDKVELSEQDKYYFPPTHSVYSCVACSECSCAWHVQGSSLFVSHAVFTLYT